MTDMREIKANVERVITGTPRPLTAREVDLRLPKYQSSDIYACLLALIKSGKVKAGSHEGVVTYELVLRQEE